MSADLWLMILLGRWADGLIQAIQLDDGEQAALALAMPGTQPDPRPLALARESFRTSPPPPVFV